MQNRFWTHRLLWSTRLLIAVLVVGLLAACAGGAEPIDLGTSTEEELPSAEEVTDVDTEAPEADMSQMEAPMLAEMVEAGELPPLEERLPTNPAVVEPVESLGQYGGTWTSALVGGQDNAWLVRTIAYEHLVRWTPEWTGVEPNIAESYEANDEATEFTFHLREGMKWSDGDDFNADDLVFWYEDILTNEEYRAAHPVANWLKGGDGEPLTVEKIDDYTVVFKFSSPNGLFLQNLATPGGSDVTRWPMHYCMQFHPDYNTENLDELIAENDATGWVNLMELKCGGVPGTPYDARWQNADLPTLLAWDIVDAYGSGTQVVAERNPYYWKTDPEGRQLPYIDRTVFNILEDNEVLLLNVLNGEVDMSSRHFNTNDNKAVLTDNREQGQYDFFETIGGGNTQGFMFNLNHQDPRMREIFQNKNFRIAMSHCINRQEIIDLLFIGQGEPMQSAVGKEVPDLYDEEMYTMYTEFDIELAHQLLEEEGFTMGDDGFFLAPDGEPFNFEVQTTEAFSHSDRAEIVVQQWQTCGVDARLKVMDRSLLYTRKDSNEHDVHVWGAGASPSIFIDPRHMFPFSAESAFAQAWQTWYNNPSGEGSLTPPEEPPAEVQRQMELYDQIKASGDYETQLELMREIVEIAKDQFYVIGLSSSPPGYGIVKDNFHNVPESMPGSWQYPTPAPTHPEQYWIEQ